MVTKHKQLLDQDVEEAEKEFLNSISQSKQQADTETVEEEITPIEEVLKEEPTEAKPVTEAPPAEEEKVHSDIDFEKEFETHEYKLDPAKADDNGYLKNRLYTSLGMLKKTASEKKAESERFNEELKNREAKLAEMQAKLDEFNSAKSNVEPEKVEDLNFEDYEMPEGFIEDLDRRYLSKQNSNYENELSKLREEIDGFKQQTYESKLWDDVNKKAPEADGISDEVFDVWLGNQNYGKDIYNAARQRGDTNTVAKLFSDCANELKTETNQPQSISESIKSQVSPQPIQHSSNDRNVEKPIFSEAEINKFDRDVRNGKYTQEEAKKHYQKIDQAMLEGRIR